MTDVDESIQEKEKAALVRLDQLLKGRKNASYQFIVLEGILRGLEKHPKEDQVSIEYIYDKFAQIAYALHKNFKIDLGGDKQSIEGKASANGIVDSFVEKYSLQSVNTLEDKYIRLLANTLMSSNIRRWPIEGITNEKIGLFKKKTIESKDYIEVSTEVKEVLLSNLEYIRKKNETALTEYLFKIPSNNAYKIMSIWEGAIRFKDILKSEYVEKYNLPEEEVKEVKPTKVYKEDELIQAIHAYMSDKGFTYPLQMIQNLYLSLKTKPFAILAGISGTGKSKIIELFAEAVGATAENGRYKLIAVRPDWSDSTELLGYRDLNNHFNPGILTSVVEQALAHPDVPYFVCLDEMNLARVEYYLSDFLSIIESRRWRGEQIFTQPLLHESVLGEDAAIKAQYGGLYIPENLYLVGTVNMDETTYPFSKKVLDRANTIEFSTVNLMDGLAGFERGTCVPLEDVGNCYMRSDYLHLMDCMAYKEEARGVIAKLEAVNQILQDAHLQFAYRMRDEVVFFMLYNKRFGLMSEAEAFELQLLQKVLPRLMGSSKKLEQVLEKLKVYTQGSYPKAYEKIEFMMERYRDDGFTSYWV